jgi:EthD domain
MMLVSRRSDISRQQFRDHYENVHAPLAASHIPRLVKYVRNYVVDQFRSGLECDVVTEFWFDHPGPWSEARVELLPDDLLALFAQDEVKFMDRDSMRVIVVEEGETPLADLKGDAA